MHIIHLSARCAVTESGLHVSSIVCLSRTIKKAFMTILSESLTNMYSRLFFEVWAEHVARLSAKINQSTVVLLDHPTVPFCYHSNLVCYPPWQLIQVCRDLPLCTAMSQLRFVWEWVLSIRMSWCHKPAGYTWGVKNYGCVWAFTW